MVSKELYINLIAIPKYFIKLIFAFFFHSKITPLKVKSINKTTLKNQLQIKSNIVNLKDVSVYSDDGIACVDNDIILDSHYLINNVKSQREGLVNVKYHANALLKNIIKPKKKLYLDSAAVVSIRWSENYHHWLFYLVPKLINLERMTNIETTYVIVNKIKTKFQKTILNHFSKFIFLESSDEYEININNALLIQSPEYNKKEVLSILNKFSLNASINSNLSRRIYISRSFAKKRRVQNESEIVKYLKTLNFEVVHLEYLNFDEQLKLFSRADIVVGPHGAGFSNIVFGKNMSIVEFIPNKSRHKYKHYENLSNYLNHDYYPLVSSIKKFQFRKFNMIIDIDSLKLLLENIIK